MPEFIGNSIYIDHYSWNLGDPLPPRKPSHKPLERWTETIIYPSLNKSLTEIYEWKQEPEPVYIGGKAYLGIYRLSVTYVDNRTGVIEDVHHYSFASGKLLEKVKSDFNKHVIQAWASARSTVSSFPKYTIAKLKLILDPATDNQPPYFHDMHYIQFKKSNLKSYSTMWEFRAGTEKGYSHFSGKLYYRDNGRVGRTESFITRRSSNWYQVKTETFGTDDEPTVTLIEDSKNGTVYKMSQAEKGKRRHAKTVEAKQREAQTRASERAARKQKQEAKAACKALARKEREERSEVINQFIVDHYGEMTQAMMGEALGISAKAVEHRVSRLREAGRIPPN